MSAFPRTVLPALGYTMPVPAQALLGIGLSGKLQARSILTLGVGWQEFYPPLNFSADAVNRGWYAQVCQLFHSGATFTIQHRSYLRQFGAGGGTPLVNGASQTGSSINTDGWPNSTTVLKAGDLVVLGGVYPVRTVTADATTNGSGQVALQIDPPYPAGQSPSDNSSVIYGASLTFNAKLVGLDEGRAQQGDEWVDGLTLTFLEQTS